MSDERGFSLRVTAAGADVDRTELEEIALQLRHDLLAAGVPGVERAAYGPAPEGTRSVELIAAAVGFVITGLSTAASAAQLAEFVQRWREAHPRRRKVEINIVTGTAGIVDPPAPAGPTRTGRRSALLVAGGEYRDPGLSGLRSPAADIRALAEVLGDPDIGGFDVQTLTDAAEPVVRRRVAAFFADRNPEDVLLLHFSCHGLKDQRGRLYLAAADTELNALAATALPASFVSERMGESESRSVLLVLDCCYSGAFARDTRGDRTVHVAEEFSRGGTGRTVFTASSATEYSFEGGQLTSYEVRPSVFTEALVRGLRTGAADLDHDGDISADELFDYAARRVRESQPGQVPRRWEFDVSGALLVARSVRPAVLPEEIRADLRSDRPVLREEAVRALAELLAGPRDGYRRAAYATLVHLRDHDDSSRVRNAAAEALTAAPAPPTPPPSPPPPSTPPPATPPLPAPVTRPLTPSQPTAPAATEPTTTAPAKLATAEPVAVDPAVPGDVAAPAVTSAPDQVLAPAVPATGDSVPAKARPGPGPSRPPGPPEQRNRRVRLMALAAAGLAVAVTVTIGLVVQHAGGDSEASQNAPTFGDDFASVAVDYDGDLESALLSPDGKWLVTLDAGANEVAARPARIWDVSTGRSVVAFESDSDPVFSPDGKIVATTAFTGKREVRTVDGQPIGVLIGGETLVELRETATGRKLATLSGHAGSAYVAFSPDGRTVATASTRASESSFDAPVRLWDRSNGQLLATLAGHDNGIQSMAFGPDGRTLVSSAAGGTTKVWDVAARKATATLANAWFPIWLSPDGATLVTRHDKGFELRSMPSGALRAAITDAGSFAGFTPDSSGYATDTDGTVRLWDLATRMERSELNAPVTGPLVFSPSGRMIAAHAKDGTPMLWDAANGQALKTLVAHSDAVLDLVFTPDGRILFTAGKDKTVRQWYVGR
ncbi:caspase family protein [Micromonospora sp. NPDC049559]|uniref:caspase, EACC1-associated type n=1 Tax=Micromonospora sp. NPDC049559 TaxID=3155923 RepID=UPI003427D471